MPPNQHIIEVEGPFACFTSPDSKVERLSLPLPTPSAARGILDSIYVKPLEFRWRITRIEILKPIRYIALRRNEVKEKITFDKKWMTGEKIPEPILADADKAITGTDQKGRTQRQTMALREVKYRIYAEIVPWPGVKISKTALDEQFVRRASSGKCFMQPYLGLREFPAYFRYVTQEEQLEKPESIDLDLGWIVYDIFDLSLSNRILHTGTIDKKSPDLKRYIKQPSISMFYAKVCNGVIDIPDYADPAVHKLGDGGLEVGV